VILAGNHTYQAALALGWTQVAAVTSELEGSDKAGFALADNRLSDLAHYDNDALLEMLNEAGTLEGTGYDSEDLDYLIRQQAAWQGNQLDPSQTGEIVRLLGLDDWDSTDTRQWPTVIIRFPDAEARDTFIEDSALMDGERNGYSFWYPAKPDDYPIHTEKPW
jgi:hypothetical protein